jgi:hypothetical protein
LIPCSEEKWGRREKLGEIIQCREVGKKGKIGRNYVVGKNE